MDIQKLQDVITEVKAPKYRLQQIKQAIYNESVGSFTDILTISKELREILSNKINILSFTVKKILVAKDQRSIKALVELSDKYLIETVLISPKPNTWSACVSSQVGCALGCAFCSTGKLGLKRNLTSEEICDQILFWRQFLKSQKIAGSFSNIVFMGMGEPFLNWDNVKKSIEELTNPEIFNFRNRAISVSTAGILDKLDDFAKTFPQANLAISLHFANDEKRNKFMKVNQLFNLNDLKIALKKYFNQTNRKIFLEYILLNEINDTNKDIADLIKFTKEVGNNNLLHINLIRYNSGSDKNFLPSSRDRAQLFKQALQKKGLSVTIRKSLGADISGACGQLAGE